MATCAYCGRENDRGAHACADCGRPLPAAGAPGLAGESAPAFSSLGGGVVPPTRVGVRCASCGTVSDGSGPFCARCGTSLSPVGAADGPVGSCRSCGAPIISAQFQFCPICGLPLTADAPGSGEGAPFASTRAAGPAPGATAPPVTLVELEADGAKGARHRLTGDETTIGRSGADITFPDDACLSPLHALLTWRDGQLTLRDLGSRNGTWVYLEGPHKLADGETILIGSQLLRFRRLGYPAPHPPEADSTRRLGSLTPAADIACLIQLRSDGSERDVLHLSPGRAITLGRERGDWTFPYDPSMSAAHAAIRSEDADFVLADAGSRNGVALAARGEVELKKGFRFLVGDKLLAVEMP